MQLKYCIRAVSPEIYDEVARCSPERCPLVWAGDLRSGHELLKSARADSMQTMDSLATSRKGRVMFSRLAEHVEAQALAIEQVLGWSGQPAPTQVPRPIAFNMSCVSFHSESPAINAFAAQGLVGMCSNWIYNNGFESERTTRVLYALPPRIFAGLSKLIETMRQFWPVELLASASAAGGGACSDPPPSYAHLAPCLTAEEEEIWEAEKEFGLMKVEFDPCTQRRTNMAINSRLASYWCQHKEECLIRFAMHEASTGLADFCGICVVISFIMSSLNCEQMYYVRMCVRVGNDIQGILVLREEVKRFNSHGQLIQVVVGGCFPPVPIPTSVPSPSDPPLRSPLHSIFHHFLRPIMMSPN